MKIGIYNGSGYKNWGDDAQLVNTILKLKERKYNDLVVFTRTSYIKNLTQTNIVPSSHNLFQSCTKGIQIIDKFDFLVENWNCPEKLSPMERKFIKNISELDVLFFAGSGTINTRHIRGVCIFLLPVALAKKMGKKVIISGQGIGPLTDTSYIPLIRDTLNSVDKIFIRDFNSGEKQLKEIGVTIPIIQGVDNAFGYPITTNRFQHLKDKKVVGINISFLLSTKLEKILYSIASWLKEFGYTPIFNHFQNETKIAEKCAKEFEVVTFQNASEIAEFYSYCKMAIGMRYHSTIFCLSQNVPHINLYGNTYQQLKIKAIEDATGLTIGIDLRGGTSREDILKKLEYNTLSFEDFNKTWQNWSTKKYLDIEEL